MASSAGNSRNHNREGQSILFVDGHCEFQMRPFKSGPDEIEDNIYTIADSLTDPVGALIGMAPDATQTRGPLTNTDSFVVP